MFNMNKNVIEELRKLLESEGSAVEKELKNFAEKDVNVKDNWKAKYPNQQDADMGEEADEVQEYDNLVSLEQNLEVRLKDIHTALKKIPEGKYGMCENCQKDIEEERLRALPEARLCINCNK